MLPVILSGCALMPPAPVVKGPLTATPSPPSSVATESTGAIYQPAAHTGFTLFEDRRPGSIGDIVTVIIQEKTNAAKSVQTSTHRKAGGELDVGVAPGLLPDVLGARQAFQMGGENSSTGRGTTRADNMFSGSLTATVVEVLPNGNLKIAGDKQIAINRGSEHIRFSGVVDPRVVTGANTVLSTQVADAKIEFRSRGAMDEVQAMGWLQRFFLSISPF